VQGDGEIIGQTPVQVRVVPRAVHVIVPPGSAEQVQSRPEAGRSELEVGSA
jgi:hypothetical protein